MFCYCFDGGLWVVLACMLLIVLDIDAATFIVCSLILFFFACWLVYLCLRFGWFSTLCFTCCGVLLVIWLLLVVISLLVVWFNVCVFVCLGLVMDCVWQGALGLIFCVWLDWSDGCVDSVGC